jgi:hypothetical protein
MSGIITGNETADKKTVAGMASSKFELEEKV